MCNVLHLLPSPQTMSRGYQFDEIFEEEKTLPIWKKSSHLTLTGPDYPMNVKRDLQDEKTFDLMAKSLSVII